MSEPKTDREIVDEANELARELNTMLGFEVPEGYRFYGSDNPRAQLAWNMAVTACEMLCAHEMSDALDSVLESEAPSPELQAEVDAITARLGVEETKMQELGRSVEETREASEAAMAKFRATRGELRRAKAKLKACGAESL